jgi:Rieske Fe-S protein
MTAPPRTTPGTLASNGPEARVWLPRGLVFSLLFGAVIGATAATSRYLWPPPAPAAAGHVRIVAADLPRPGDAPMYVPECRCFVVAVAAGEGPSPYLPPGLPVPATPRAGLLVLSARSPWRGCTITWQSRFTLYDAAGWLRDPCHGAVFTSTGLPVLGPTPRPMDTIAAHQEPDGTLTVFVGRTTPGAFDNPLRVLPPAR